MKDLLKVGVLSTLTLLASCASVGPRQIMYNRNDYNTIIRDTDAQELLLNIVRLRYLEPVGFLKVSNIAGSTSISSNLGFSSSWTPLPTQVSQFFTNNLGVNYSESPTVSYMPVESSEFTKRLIAPISLESAYLLSFGGVYDNVRLFRLIMQNIGDYENVSSSANSRTGQVPDVGDIDKLLQPIDWLDKHQAFKLYSQVEEKQFKLVVYFKKKYRSSPAALALKKQLHIDPRSNSIILSQVPDLNDKLEVLVATRSILGMMVFLSHGVEVPQDEIKKGIVTQNRYPDGRVFDWNKVMNKLIKIHCSDERPMNSAFVKVFYRGHWFFISDSDLDAKVTFTILTQLIAIAGGQNSGQNNAPIFTIPVGPAVR